MKVISLFFPRSLLVFPFPAFVLHFLLQLQVKVNQSLGGRRLGLSGRVRSGRFGDVHVDVLVVVRVGHQL